MNQGINGNRWRRLSVKLKRKWMKLDDDDLSKAKSNKGYLLGKLHRHYGLTQCKAEQFLRELGYY